MHEAGHFVSGVFHAPGHLQGEKQRLLYRQGLAGDQPGAQRCVAAALFLRHQFQREIDFAAIADPVNVVAAHDVGMPAQVNPGRAFAQKAVTRGPVGQELWLKGLQCHGAVFDAIHAQVDNPHAAQERATGDFVAIGDDGSGWVDVHGRCPFT